MHPPGRNDQLVSLPESVTRHQHHVILIGRDEFPGHFTSGHIDGNAEDAALLAEILYRGYRAPYFGIVS